jgi:hypothetical protein
VLTDPKEVLRKSQEALKAATVVSYRAEYKPEGWVTEFVPKVDGTATVGKQTSQAVDRFYTEVKFAKPGTEDVKQYTAGCDGNEYYLVDAAGKTVYQDLDPAVLGSQSRHIRRLVLTEFGEAEPFAEAFKKGELELKGTSKVGEEECYEVVIKGLNPPTMVWWISTKDFLPRQVKRVLMREGKEGSTLLTLDRLKLAKYEKDKEPFKLEVPAGYTKTGDFAP